MHQLFKTSVTLALGPKEDPESKNETGQDKDPEGRKDEDPNSTVAREEKQPEGCKEDPKPAQPDGQQKKEEEQHNAVSCQCKQC